MTVDLIRDAFMIAVTAMLAVRLCLSGLSRRYRSFFLFLILEFARDLALLPLNPSGAAYYKVWVLTEPMEWLFYALVVLEIYSLVLADYRGLYTAGRWCLMLAVGVSLACAALTLAAPVHSVQQSQLMTYYYVAERAVYFSLAVFLLTILALLMRYPIVLNRNIIAHSLIFSTYFLVCACSYQLLSAGGFRMIGVVRLAITLLNVGTLGAWLVALTQAGEQRRQQLHPSWMPGREEELVGQLQRLNFALQGLIN
ncbi:MAG TPA: hypothetical protein VMT86_17285 [Bryobacteraceae bacterium]|nr:hypothetical protein [Bryobacteraceae bacterium]